MQEELLDFVNERDEVIGVMTRSQAYAEKRLASLRAIWFLIKNKEGKFWIPMRASSKESSPNTLDGSTVGHVSSGETYEQAMIREVAEELQMDVSTMPYRLVGSLTPTTGSVSFIQIFDLLVPDDLIIDYNKEDFSHFYWLSPQEIIQKFEDGEKMRPTLVSIIKKFY